MSPLRAAKVEHSPRLQAVLACLRKHGDDCVNTWQIRKEAGVQEIGVAIAELRANGFEVRAVRFGRGSVYRLVE